MTIQESVLQLELLFGTHVVKILIDGCLLWSVGGIFAEDAVYCSPGHLFQHLGLVVAGLYECMTKVALIASISKGKKIVSSSLQQELEGLLEELHDATCTCLGRKQHMKRLVKTKQIVLQGKDGSL
jgi:hypothetical protein